MSRPKGLPKTGGRVKGTPNKQESPIARALREAREKAMQEARDSVAAEQLDAHSSIVIGLSHGAARCRELRTAISICGPVSTERVR